MDGRILYTARDTKSSKKKISKKEVWILLILAGLVAFFVGVVFSFRLPYWQIKKVEVVSSGVLTPQEIRVKIDDFLLGKILFFLPQSSFFLFSSSVLASVLQKEFPQIEAASVKKEFPDSLRVVVKERELFGIFCNEECVYIDKHGFAYDYAPSSFGSLLIKIKSDAAQALVGSTVIRPDLMNEIVFLSSEIGKISGIRAAGYELFSKVSSEIKMETSEGFKIFFKRGGNFENTFRVLKTVLEREIKGKRSQLEYIDLRFGNKVFYKFKKD